MNRLSFIHVALATIISTSSVVCAVSPAHLRAQQALDTVVFVHGLGQSKWTWGPMEADLEARHPIFSVDMTLPSLQPYGDQANVLRAFLDSWHGGAIHGAAAITHSNGGVVLREYVRTEASPRVDAHLSLGTPHRGGRLAQRLQDGTIGLYMGLVLGDVLSPFAYYIIEDPDWHELLLGGHSSNEAEFEADVIADLLDYGLPVAGFIGLSYYVSESQYAEILPHMWPGSSTFSALNGSQALGAEAQKLSRARASISSQYPNFLAPFRVGCIGSVDPSLCTVQLWQFWSDLLFFADEAYEYYLYHPDWNLRNNAWRWDQMYVALSTLPAAWADWTESWGDQGDGIVSWASSAYPQGTNDRHVTVGQGLYVHHVEQLDAVPDHDSDPFRVEVSRAIEDDLGIVPPPAPLNVSIGGPSEVPPGDDLCNWWANASGGGGPYQYAWSGVLSGTQSTVTGPVEQSGWLYLTVTSGTAQGSAQTYVTVTAGAEPCSAGP